MRSGLHTPLPLAAIAGLALTAASINADTILIDDDFESGTFASWTPADNALVWSDSDHSTSWASSGDKSIQLKSRPGGSITLTDALPLDTPGHTSVTISYNLKFESPSSTRRTYVSYADDGVNFVDLGYVVNYQGPVSYTLDEGTGPGEFTFTDQAKFRIRFYDTGAAPRAYIDDVVITGMGGPTGPDPVITSITVSDKTATMTFTGKAGTSYVCKSSTNLPDFPTIETPSSGTLTTDDNGDGTGDATFSVDATPMTKFYLVEE